MVDVPGGADDDRLHTRTIQHPGRQIKRERKSLGFSFFLRMQAGTIYAFFC